MTDKQIIIDGVDVAECEYFNRFRNICHNKNLCCDCGKNQDCCYKQLKRKEQECDKLYIQLKADGEYHKEEENALRKIIKNKKERNIELYKENKKYKQALDEIEKYLDAQQKDFDG